MKRSLALLLLACACSDDPEPPPTGEWISLLSGGWSLAPGQEKYVCVRTTLAHPIEIARLRPEAGDGTHHTMLTIAEDSAPDGVSDCDGYENGQVALFASGYGTGAALLKLAKDGQGVKATEVYFLPANDFQNHHGQMILHEGHIYAGRGHNEGFPCCLELATGKLKWGD